MQAACQPEGLMDLLKTDKDHQGFYHRCLYWVGSRQDLSLKDRLMAVDPQVVIFLAVPMMNHNIFIFSPIRSFKVKRLTNRAPFQKAVC